MVIAVGFDGSAPSEAAAKWAFSFALQIDADVVLVHAVGILEHLGHQTISEQFAGSVQTLATDIGFDASRIQWHVDNGDACSVLLRAAQAPISATLLVVGSRGKGAHAGHLLGSTSLQLAERSAVPLVIIPAGALVAQTT
jgi:nucleotide-binding universal stress UspA family protein